MFGNKKETKLVKIRTVVIFLGAITFLFNNVIFGIYHILWNQPESITISQLILFAFTCSFSTIIIVPFGLSLLFESSISLILKTPNLCKETLTQKEMENDKKRNIYTRIFCKYLRKKRPRVYHAIYISAIIAFFIALYLLLVTVWVSIFTGNSITVFSLREWFLFTLISTLLSVAAIVSFCDIYMRQLIIGHLQHQIKV